MVLDANVRRRWFGAVVLFVALGMLICGETILKGKLADFTFIAYWLGCLVLTSLAILIAFLDARALQRRIRREQHDLFETTLKQIQSEAKSRSGRPDRKRPK